MEPGFVPISTLDRVFLFSAALGALAVAWRVVSLATGWDAEDDGGEDGVRILSVHGLSSFFLMFGLVGLALSRQSEAAPGFAILGALAAGLGALWIIAHLCRLALRLQANGTLHPQAAAGCVGTVYQKIPPGGTGRVNVRIGQRVREMDAMHAGDFELPTGTPIRVIRVIRVDRALAVVQPLSPLEMS